MGSVILPITPDMQATLKNWKRILETVLNGQTAAATSLNATRVNVQDSGGYFNGTNAETVLAELGGRILYTTLLPVASSGYARQMMYVTSTAKVADDLYICRKTSNDSYSWWKITT